MTADTAILRKALWRAKLHIEATPVPHRHVMEYMVAMIDTLTEVNQALKDTGGLHDPANDGASAAGAGVEGDAAGQDEGERR
jgi:hypothetical protein